MILALRRKIKCLIDTLFIYVHPNFIPRSLLLMYELYLLQAEMEVAFLRFCDV